MACASREENWFQTKIRKYTVPSKEEERALAKRKAEGDQDAFRELVVRNLRLVAQYAYGLRGRGLSFLDLMQEGVIGLMTAVEKFDLSYSNQFSTYAGWWIEQSMFRAIANTGTTIRLPVYMHDKVKRFRRATHQLKQKLQRSPSDIEIGNELGILTEEVQHLSGALKIRSLASLDTPLGEKEELNLHDSLFDRSQLDSETIVAARDELQHAQRELCPISWYLKAFPVRNQLIFLMRYGLHDGSGDGMTLEGIGQVVSLTRERVRQITNKVWMKMRAEGWLFDEESLLIQIERIKNLEVLAGQGVDLDFLPEGVNLGDWNIRRTSSINQVQSGAQKKVRMDTKRIKKRQK
jgi:RNA polymerase primary sigma factor